MTQTRASLGGSLRPRAWTGLRRVVLGHLARWLGDWGWLGVDDVPEQKVAGLEPAAFACVDVAIEPAPAVSLVAFGAYDPVAGVVAGRAAEALSDLALHGLRARVLARVAAARRWG